LTLQFTYSIFVHGTAVADTAQERDQIPEGRAYAVQGLAQLSVLRIPARRVRSAMPRSRRASLRDNRVPSHLDLTALSCSRPAAGWPLARAGIAALPFAAAGCRRIAAHPFRRRGDPPAGPLGARSVA
jgi:hypothetical protein